MTRLAFALLALAASCWAADDQDTSSWKHPEPITYESLRAWHQAGGLQGYFWPKEHDVSLTDDQAQQEVFLGTTGFSRGMVYALFTRTKSGRWRMLADAVEGNHFDPEVLPAKHGRWHDFSTMEATGRGPMLVFVYTFNGRHYVQKSVREVRKEDL